MGLCCVVSCHVMLCCVVMCCIVSSHVVLCRVMLHCVVLCYVMSYHIITCHVMTCHIMSCHVMSCFLLCCAVLLCCVIWCVCVFVTLPGPGTSHHATLHHINAYLVFSQGIHFSNSGMTNYLNTKDQYPALKQPLVHLVSHQNLKNERIDDFKAP